MRRFSRLLPVLGFALLAFTPTPAQAAFPGASGRIAYQHFVTFNPTTSDIFTADPTGNDVRQLAVTPAARPVWSPDGQEVAFNGAGGDIYVIEADGTGQRQLTSGPAFDVPGSWSPSGDRIVFSSNRNGPRSQIYTVRSDGLDIRQLTNETVDLTGPTWSPVGDRIAFEKNCDIWSMNADGSDQRNLTHVFTGLDECASGPDWSPDGSRIVYSFDPCEGGHCGSIEIMDADGQNLTNVTAGDADTSPAWSPDGREIAFVREGLPPTPCTSAYCLHITSVDGSQQRYLGIPEAVVPDWQPLAAELPSYPRPTGATPLRVPLVPAFKPCEPGSGGIFLSRHGGGLPRKDSCPSPQLSSSTVRLGGSTAGGTRIGFATSIVCTTTAAPGCSVLASVPDVRLFGNGSDVVCAPGAPAVVCPGGAGSDYDPNPNAGPYTSGLDPPTNSNKAYPAPLCAPAPPNPGNCAAGADMTAVATIPDSTSSSDRAIRVTDSFNDARSVGDPSDCGATSSCTGTVQDQGFPVPVVCKANSDPSLGSYCGANTTANALVPGVVVGGKAAVVEIGEIQVYDSGPDGVRGNSDDELIAVQGLFVP